MIILQKILNLADTPKNLKMRLKERKPAFYEVQNVNP